MCRRRAHWQGPEEALRLRGHLSCQPSPLRPHLPPQGRVENFGHPPQVLLSTWKRWDLERRALGLRRGHPHSNHLSSSHQTAHWGEMGAPSKWPRRHYFYSQRRRASPGKQSSHHPASLPAAESPGCTGSTVPAPLCHHSRRRDRCMRHHKRLSMTQTSLRQHRAAATGCPPGRRRGRSLGIAAKL